MKTKTKKKNITSLAESLGHQGILKNLGVIFLIVGAFLVNISISHYAENNIREINSNATELKQLRWKYIDEKSNLMRMTKESELAQRAVLQDIHVLKSPPSKIEIQREIELLQE